MVESTAGDAGTFSDVLECCSPPPLLFEGHQCCLQQRQTRPRRILGSPSHAYMLTRMKVTWVSPVTKVREAGAPG